MNNFNNIIFAGIIISILLLMGCSSQSTIQTNDRLSKNNDVDFCTSLIPPRINLRPAMIEGVVQEGRYISTEMIKMNDVWVQSPQPLVNNWMDGTPISKNVMWFGRGSEAGQNVNYLYGQSQKYVKKQVSESGVIGEDLVYSITLVLNHADVNDEGFKVIGYQCCKDDTSKNTVYNLNGGYCYPERKPIINI